MKIKKSIRLLALVSAALIVLGSMLLTPVSAADSTLNDYQQQLDSLDKQIENNKKKLANVNSDLKDSKSKYNALTSEIDRINDQIGLLDSKVSVLNGNIAALQSDIDAASTDIEQITNQVLEIEKQIDESNALMDETKKLLLGRIRENYISGESSTLEMLFSSNDISTYFARKELITRVSENDEELITSLTAGIKSLGELQTNLENQKSVLEAKQAEMQSEITTLSEREADLQDSIMEQNDKKSSVSSKQKELSKVIQELDENSEEYKIAIKKQEAEREKLNAQIDEYIRAHASAVGDTPDAAIVNDGNMLWPVSGSTRITAGYPAYSNGSSHWGIDIVKTDGTTKGSPFRAAQGGKVIIAVNDGGWNYGFGNYCVIDHGDGKMTLYAHSSSIRVSVGQIVTKGQTIGLIGDTGNTTGPHLHFEVRIKNADGSVSRVNPLKYVSQ